MLKHNQPLEDSARKLLGYYELSDDPPYHFVLDDNSDRAHEEWFRNFSTSVFTSFAPHPKDNTSARASVDILLVRKLVEMRERCDAVPILKAMRTHAMVSGLGATLGHAFEIEMLCSVLFVGLSLCNEPMLIRCDLLLIHYFSILPLSSVLVLVFAELKNPLFCCVQWSELCQPCFFMPWLLLQIDIAFRKQVMVLHCLELIFRAYIRTIQMLSTLSQLEEVEMLCS